MNEPLSIVCRAATREDIPAVLRLYAQPDLDDGRVLSLSEAERLFERISDLPRLQNPCCVQWNTNRRYVCAAHYG